MSKHSHIMVDLETLGTVPGCVGFSIGAVEFFPDTGTIGSEFEVIVNIEDCLDKYLRKDQDTLDWWDKQSPEARVALDHAHDPDKSTTLASAMNALNAWLRGLSKPSLIRMYGNGADFDNPILRCMYDAAGVNPYAAPYGGRCYRTLKNLDELFGPRFRAHKLTRSGTFHNALDDARSQAYHLMEFVTAMKGIFNTDDEGPYS